MHHPLVRLAARASAVMLVVFGLAGCGINAVPTQDEQVKAAWSQVLNQYQRRADLIPNLVDDREGLRQAGTDGADRGHRGARARDPDDAPVRRPDQPAGLPPVRAEPGGDLGGALGRLLAVSEAYPDLKSNQNFLALQSQLEGTENRIAVARRDYIDAVQHYNTTLRTIPSRWVAAIFYPDAKPRETFTISEQAQQAPHGAVLM